MEIYIVVVVHRLNFVNITQALSSHSPERESEIYVHFESVHPSLSFVFLGSGFVIGHHGFSQHIKLKHERMVQKRTLGKSISRAALLACWEQFVDSLKCYYNAANSLNITFVSNRIKLFAGLLDFGANRLSNVSYLQKSIVITARCHVIRCYYIWQLLRRHE